MSAPTIGKAGNRHVGIDLERLLEGRLLIQANSGGGKSFALRRLLEQTHGCVQQLVIDSEDEFLTLRERLDLVVAAPHGGDCVADPRSAALLARRLLELGVSAVLAIYELKQRQRVAFVSAFVDALVNAPKDLWHPVLVVIDEAHIYCPEKGHGEAASAGAVIDLMTRGRKRGFAGVLATQRISKLNKDAAAEAVNKLVGRTNLDVDVKRAADDLGFGRDRYQELKGLEPGDFFAAGPALCGSVTQLRVGPVETTHPKAGQRAVAPPPPRAAVQKLLAELADLPKEAEEEVRSLADAKAQIRQLEAELRKKPTTPATPAQAPERIEVPIVPPGLEASIAELGRLLQAAGESFRGASVALGTKLDEVVRAVAAVKAKSGAPALRAAQEIARLPTTPRPRPAPSNGNGQAPGHDGEHLPPARQRILDALAWLGSVGIEQADRRQLAFFSGQAPTSGGYRNHLGALRSAGYVDYPSDGFVALAEKGIAAAAVPEAPATTKELQRAIFGQLPPARVRILEALVGVYPDSMDRAALAVQSGQAATSGGYRNHLGALRSLGVVAYPRDGEVVATGLLFLEAER